MRGTFSAEQIAGKIEACHSPHILWVAANNSGLTGGQMDMKMVSK
jgi:hypothetical protein